MQPTSGEHICPHCGFAGDFVPPEYALQPGTILSGRYLIGNVLGQGGFGITYIGRDTTLERRVAIKEYFPFSYATRSTVHTNCLSIADKEQADDIRGGMQRFLREARVLAKFDSEPGVVKVLDCFEANDTAYIVMEFLQGRDLRVAVQEKPFAADDLFARMLPLMRALEKIHAQHVLHRDISPDNIMLLPDGSMKLMDFGAARDMESDDKSRSVTLKRGYAPPEQYTSRGELGPRSDIYALCATIYKCITGLTPPDAVERSMDDNIRWPSEMGVSIRPAQENALKKGMEIEAQYRPKDISALRAMLLADDDVTVYQPRSAASRKNRPAYAPIEPEAENPAPEIQNPPEKKTDKSPKKKSEKTPEKKPENIPEKKPLHARVWAILTAAVLVLAIAGGIVLWPKDTARKADSAEPTITIRLTANEETGVAAFSEDIAILRGRLDVLCGEKPYSMQVENEKITLQLPESALCEHAAEHVLRSYLTRPIEMYLFDGAGDNTWNPEHVALAREDMASVKLCGGTIPGTDSPCENGYIEFTLTDECLARIGETVSAWGENIRYGQDLEMDSYAWQYCVRGEDEHVFYLRSDGVPAPFLRMILHNMTNAPLSHAFYYTLQPETDWEDPADAIYTGKNQVSAAELGGGCATMCYSTYASDMTGGEWLDTVTAFKQRLDSLGQPYAFGTVRGKEHSIAVRTSADHLGMPILWSLGQTYPFTLASGLVYTSLPGSGKMTVDDGALCFTPDAHHMEEGQTYAELIRQSAGEEILLMTAYMPMLSCASAAEDGTLRFDGVFSDEQRAITPEDSWVLEYILSLHSSVALPQTYTLNEYALDDGAQFGLHYDSLHEQTTEDVLSVHPQAKVLYDETETSVYIYLNLDIDETLPAQALELAKQIYRAVDFPNTHYHQLTLYLVKEEDDIQKERARIFFNQTRAYSTSNSAPGSVSAHGIFINGRLERYKDAFRALVENDEFYQSLIDPQGMLTWLFEQ